MSRNLKHSKKTITQAILLAAGLGTRLRPLTKSLPKPLIPLGGRALIDYTITLLARHGINHIVINLHHLGDQIQTYVGDGSRYQVHVSYSDEPVILGTGGGIRQAASLLRREPFFVMNSDILTDYDLSLLSDIHSKENPMATLVIRPLAKKETYARLEVDDTGRLVGFGRGDYMFTGLHLIEPELVEILPKSGPACIIRDGYMPLLDNHIHIHTACHRGYWNDLGTMARYEESQKDMASKKMSSSPD